MDFQIALRKIPVTKIYRDNPKMRDEADIANEQMEVVLAAALTHRKPVMRPTGSCYNCGYPVPGVYCDADCREDHEKRVRAQKYRR